MRRNGAEIPLAHGTRFEGHLLGAFQVGKARCWKHLKLIGDSDSDPTALSVGGTEESESEFVGH